MARQRKGIAMKIVGHIRRNKRGFLVSVAAVVALATTAAFTLGAFSATIVNPTSNFSSATIQLEEGNGVTTCYSTGTGAGGSVTAANSNALCGINVLTGTLGQVPGGTALTSTITLTNAGNHAASVATLVAGACSAAASSDDNNYVGADLAGNAFCGKVDVTIANTTTGATDKCVYPTQALACPALSNTYNLTTLATAGTFNTTPMSALAPAGTATYVVTAQLDAGATNADQGLTATVPFTWSISQ
jgi:hypothetical protein